MRGYPDFNFPAFDSASSALRALGHEVFSPAERDRETHGASFGAGTSGSFSEVPEFSIRAALSADLQWVCENADAVVLLDGWNKSLGARAEAFAGRCIGIPVTTLRRFLHA
jgi:hypothetical protein